MGKPVTNPELILPHPTSPKGDAPLEVAKPPKGGTPPEVAKPDVAVGFCSGYQVYTKFLECLIALVQTHPRVGWVVSTISGPAMMDARRDVVMGFLKDTPAKYLLMVDTDIIFNPSDLDLLFKVLPEPGVASGLYVDSNGYPVAGYFKPDGGYSPLPSPAPVDPLRVDAVGAGFLLIPREVLENLPGGPTQAFDHLVGPTGRVLGEDVSFCRRLAEAKVPIFLHPEVFLGHLKVRQLYPDGSTLP